jgi:hypothetical protein
MAAMESTHAPDDDGAAAPTCVHHRRLQRLSRHIVAATEARGAAVMASKSAAEEQTAAGEENELSPEHAYQFDVNGFFVIKGHYSAEEVAEFHRGIDELQAIPVEHAEYTRLGIAHPALTVAQNDPDHEVWKQPGGEGSPPPFRVDHAICGTTCFDRIVRDPVLRKIHETLAGGAVMLSATYYIEKHGPGAPGGGLHFGGFPKQRNFHYDYDHTSKRFNCFSTKATICLSDMSSVEHGPFACIPGSHKANLACPYDMVFEGNLEGNPMVVPVCASPGDVVIFTEGITRARTAHHHLRVRGVRWSRRACVRMFACR